jgi:glycosyltransferase involved in cell wall biosynthesis
MNKNIKKPESDTTVVMDLLVITREFPPYVLGGISYHLYNLYSQIGNEHQVTILSGKSTDSKKVTEGLNLSNIEIEYIPFGSMSGYHLRFPVKLYSYLNNKNIKNYDIAFLHTEIPFDLDIPTVGKFHDYKPIGRQYQKKNYTILENAIDNIINPSRHWVFRRYLKTVDHYIFNSRLCSEYWMDNFRFYNNYSVIYNGVDTDIFYPRNSNGEEFYLFVGESERKGVQRVIEFAQRTEEQVMIVGDIDRPLPSSVQNRKYVSQTELAELYSKAKATIHPANFEAFGNVILESLACGTPVVASPKCGASEILTSSTGRVSSNIYDGISDIEDCSKDSCIELANNYSWGNVAKKTMDLAKKFESIK